MTDRIIDCSVFKEDGRRIQYEFIYELEDSVTKKANEFIIVVNVKELTDPTDITEVKTKANAKAKVLKIDWLKSLKEVKIIETKEAVNITGDVTL